MAAKPANKKGGEPTTPSATITIVTNHLMRVKNSEEASWIGGT